MGRRKKAEVTETVEETKKTRKKKIDYYCQQHVCPNIDTCSRSWVNMPSGIPFYAQVFKPNDKGECKQYTQDIIKQTHDE